MTAHLQDRLCGMFFGGMVALAAAVGLGQIPVVGEGQRDGIRGVREQDQAARRTSNQLNRDARQEARARLDAQMAMPAAPASALRGADLGLWFSGGQPGATTGLTIADVANQGLFFQTGLREGDRVLSINGQPVTTEAQFIQMLTSPSVANQTANITIARGNQQQTFAVHTGTLMQAVTAADPLYESGVLIDDSNRNQLVVQRVFPRTPAFYAGLRAGDVLTSVNGEPISNVDLLTRAFQSHPENVGLIVTRNGQARHLNLNFDNGFARTAMRSGFGAAATARSGLNATGGVTPSTATVPPTTIPGNSAPLATAPSALQPFPGTMPVPGTPGAANTGSRAASLPGGPGSINAGVRAGTEPPAGAGTRGGTGATAGGTGAVGGTGALIGGTGSTSGGAGAVGGTGAAGTVGGTPGGAGTPAGGTSGTGTGGAGTGGAGTGGAGAGGGTGGAGGSGT